MSVGWIIFIVLASLLLIAIIAANIELSLFLSPHGFWAKIFKTKKAQPGNDILLKEDDLKEKVQTWLEKAKVKNLWTTSFDSLCLHALCIRQKKLSHKWVICLHGYSGHFLTVEAFGLEYFNHSYNVLLPDMRSYGKSQGQSTGMGYLEKKDILEWIKEILKIDSKAEIVLHGVSMGAACVMMLSGEKLSENVKCLVSDCAYTSVWDEFKEIRKNKFHLPAFPMLYLCGLFCKIRKGFFFHQASCTKALSKCEKPVYMIHGAEDKFVPCKMIIKNYMALKDVKKDWYLLAGTEHAQALYKNSELYWRKIFSFVDQFVGLPSAAASL